jgi:prophage antirepressor-like protein
MFSSKWPKNPTFFSQNSKKMNTDIQIFTSKEFGRIRTCQVNHQIMFVGKDVAKALGYSNTRDALNKHVDPEDKGTVAIRDTAYETRAVAINESGLYALILSSKLEQAKAFKRWVTSEVLPQIRQTGGYIPTRDRDGRPLTDEEIVERACEITGRTLSQMNRANEHCLTATKVAELWGMDVQSFNNLLAGMGIQHRKGGRWQLTEALQGRGLAEERSFFCFSLKGKPRMRRYLVWTPEGVDYLNLAVRKLPREITANVQLFFNF